MTQLSRPYQIALLALALLVLVWFVALHGHAPSSGSGSASGSSPSSAVTATAPSAAAQAKAAAAPTGVYHGPAPGVEGLTRAIDRAHGAVAQSQQEAHRVETSEPAGAPGAASESGATSSGSGAVHQTPGATSGHASAPATRTGPQAAKVPAPATGAKSAHPAPASAVSGLSVHTGAPAPHRAALSSRPALQALVEGELRHHQTVLILFWNSHGSVDEAVHNALPAVQRKLGADSLAVHYATAGKVGAFGTITHTVQVTQTPTLLIVTPGGQTTALTGLKDAFAIEQAVRQARHPS